MDFKVYYTNQHDELTTYTFDSFQGLLEKVHDITASNGVYYAYYFDARGDKMELLTGDMPSSVRNYTQMAFGNDVDLHDFYLYEFASLNDLKTFFAAWV